MSTNQFYFIVKLVSNSKRKLLQVSFATHSVIHSLSDRAK